jgi:MOSC domain-containing protein
MKVPTLRETDYEVEIVWLGQVPAAETIQSVAQDSLTLGFDGVAGERHEGTIAPSCVRVSHMHPQGTSIRNVRQLSILSQEELAQIASDMGLEAVNPAHLGTSVVLRGIPDFTHVPPSSRLQADDGCTLVIDMENTPCVFPGKEIERTAPGHGPRFKPAAKGRRGVTAWVQRPGQLRVGDKLRLYVPDQRAWAP